ncbi:hypothetical protein HMPREF9318_00409 [Streptococcus urinalis FB127-CNA-2]|uniref:Ribonuclease HII n=1 Tax=Streptococcus urinalis 2285-97 TaxID=764291 RepID=G5KG01_9STRE|nr:ribonuclease HII [Streptococcus urinalis]EHJ57450.1 ribonuclease HII [Streptococcus urinalis 2285-97]EKS22211.1 hypothetical protein HMPREF9318_00409 [Streptococcus urinalis FB127-CNA-2]VEF32023.1 ribonuclease HII [Streptococcus urinalis]
MKTIKKITEELNLIDKIDDPRWEEYLKDNRKGVSVAITRRQKAILSDLAESERLDKMLIHEKQAYQEGYCQIAGIDEVGRGPLAGPVVAAAVILPKNCKIKGLNDSKKIPKSKHRAIYQDILNRALAVGVGIKDNTIIDQVNIYEATKLAMLEAVSNLSKTLIPDLLLIDAMTLDTQIPQKSMIKGDANSLSIASASIVAKVTRDDIMTDFAKIYPNYDFDHNAGYGTKNHLAGIKTYGITPIHRKSFEPIKSYNDNTIF